MSILVLMAEELWEPFQFRNQWWSEYIDSAMPNNFYTEKDLNSYLLELYKKQKWIIAIRLERQYTKNEIIAMYCNVMILETILLGKFRS
jgi:hypothetical protein